jgi:hypothetical protein
VLLALLFVVVVVMVKAITFAPGEMMDKPVKTVFRAELSDKQWQTLAGKKVFFGHQSVGNNILAGVADLQATGAPVRLKIEKTEDPGNYDKPILGHSHIGANGDPVSKIDAFKVILESGIGGKVGVALMKLCYVDIKEGTDLDQVFGHYKKTMANLAGRFPGVELLHSTVPLVALQSGPKAFVKKILGSPLYGVADNAARGRYNDMLRREYGSTGKLFDLAACESTGPAGKELRFKLGKELFQAMLPAYTNDGGHLNETGRRLIAQEFLLFLASAGAGSGG